MRTLNPVNLRDAWKDKTLRTSKGWKDICYSHIHPSGSFSPFIILLSWLEWFTWEASGENILINPVPASLPSITHLLMPVRRRSIFEMKHDTIVQAVQKLVYKLATGPRTNGMSRKERCKFKSYHFECRWDVNVIAHIAYWKGIFGD